ncbi:MAG TPA: peptidoglycan-binding protein, partial [Acidobacteriaceae bacterium]|nr:peptidoglycan-binding protein [Acidobacteriaceae bacterium]
MMQRTLRSTLAVCLLGCFLLPLGGCRGGIKSLWAKFHHRRSKSKPNTTDYADNIESLVTSGRVPIMRWVSFAPMQEQVQQFYDGRNYELAWTRDGQPTEAAQSLMQMFSNAAQKGLVPADYDADRWAGRVQQLHQIAKKNDTSDDAQNAIADFDVAMTVAAMRYVSDLHFGRVNPQALNFDINVPARRAQFDLAGFVDQLVDADDIPGTLARLEPDSPMYKATEEALPKYMQLAQQQAANPPQFLPPVDKPVSKGRSYPALPQLWARLQLEGDAPADAPAPTRFNSDMEDALKHYQQRNGLTDDGKLTQATIDAMNVPMSRRVQQIDDALERWRWLPENFQQPRVLVNLPEFMLRAYDEDHNLAFKMKVIDGEAEGNHDTPMFVRTMRYVIFRPYWN